MMPLLPDDWDKPRLIARHWSVLCLGAWQADNTDSELRFFIYRATHPAPAQRDAYERSVAATGLRFHDPGPDWFADPNAICAASRDPVPSAYHRVVLERHYGMEALYQNGLHWGDPWRRHPEGWEQDTASPSFRLAALLIWFLGRSIPEFEFASLQEVPAQEVRDRIPGIRNYNHRADYCINGWARMGLPYTFGIGTLTGLRWANDIMPAPAPASGLYVLDRYRALRYGDVVRALPVVAPVRPPMSTPDRFDAWVKRANEEMKRVMPGRRAVLAGQRAFFQTTQDAVLFRLAVDAE